jgi:hypothetical protein
VASSNPKRKDSRPGAKQLQRTRGGYVLLGCYHSDCTGSTENLRYIVLFIFTATPHRRGHCHPSLQLSASEVASLRAQDKSSRARICAQWCVVLGRSLALSEFLLSHL